MESPNGYGHLFFLCNIIILGFVSGVTCSNANDTKLDLIQEPGDYTDDSSPAVHYHDKRELIEDLVQVLRDIGYNSLAIMMIGTADNDSLVGWKGRATLFAPTDEAFRNSTYNLSSPDLLNQHIVKGIFSSKSLALLRVGTKLETLADGHSLVITRDELNGNSSQVYVNGTVLAYPDIFNDGLLAIHGIDSFLGSNISPLPHLPSTVYPANTQPNVSALPRSMRFILRDSIHSLRDRGYSILALALRLTSGELLGFRNLTVFAVSDETIFSGGQEFVKNVRYHVIPNRRLLFADLLNIPVGTAIETLLHRASSILTNNRPVSINNVPLKNPDVFVNEWMAVHEIPIPLSYYAASVGRATDAKINDSSIFV